MDSSQVASFLKAEVPIFREMSRQQIEGLLAKSRVTTFEPNEAVIEFGEEGRFLGVLLEGEAESSIADERGERHRLAALRAGDVFGEMALMTGDRTTADVIGITRCRAVLIPQPEFSALLAMHPPAIRHLSKTLSERMRRLARAEDDRALAATAFRKSEDPFGLRLRTERPLRVLVVNCGSSSLKYDLYDTRDPARRASGAIERIGTSEARHVRRLPAGETAVAVAAASHAEAFGLMLEGLVSGPAPILAGPESVDAVGHRVVHGGSEPRAAAVLDASVLAAIERASVLAPLHNPANLSGIREAMRVFGQAVHVAVFDTAFHHTLPPYAYLYGLPYACFEREQIRRYGFHGMSHKYVALRAAEYLKRRFNELEIVSCHLGNGASICAIDHGRSVDTSMGLTPTEGLIMGTRCGDVDPGALTYLMRRRGLNAEQLDRLINEESGLKGLSGISNDMREVSEAAARGEHRALLAFKAFCYRVRKYIGAYVAAMAGIDVLVFTGGIGQGSVGVRSLACQGLACMGIRIDEARNRAAAAAGDVCDIAAENAAVRVLVIQTDEQRMIAREVIRALGRRDVGRILSTQAPTPVTLEVSAHHVHLCEQHVAALFGEARSLTPESELSQPGQYACKETVHLVGPKGRVENVRVLAPPRARTQIEISMSEQFKLGIHPPVRESGDLDGTPGITLEGPAGSLALHEGVICALRHIHAGTEEALRLGLRDRDVVRVRVEGDRELTFGDVLVRVRPDFKLVMHLDTYEANAAGIKTGMTGYIDEIQHRA